MAKKRRNRTASLRHEREYHRSGFKHILGIDEVGRGPLAGPVVAGAVCLPIHDDQLSQKLKGVRDSKDMTALQREALTDTIKETAIAWGIGVASVEEIDKFNILEATKLAMERAVQDSMVRFPDFRPDVLFLDSVLLPKLVAQYPQVSIVEGDKRTLSIAAASVIAKVWRDAYMSELHEELPHYGFDVNKGYGTAQHLAAIQQFGPSPQHRRSFEPVKSLFSDGENDV